MTKIITSLKGLVIFLNMIYPLFLFTLTNNSLPILHTSWFMKIDFESKKALDRNQTISAIGEKISFSGLAHINIICQSSRQRRKGLIAKTQITKFKLPGAAKADDADPSRWRVVRL